MVTINQLIGLTVEVNASKNATLVGLKGRVVDETKSTLVIQTSKGKKRVIKSAAEFKFEIGGGTVVLAGKTLCTRPEDKIKR